MIPALVMTANEGSNGAREGHRTDNLGADLRVHLHLFPLVRRQRARLGQDVLRHGKFPDVVQQRCDLDRLCIRISQLEPACQRRRVILHTLDVGTAAPVLRLNRARKHLGAVAVQLRPFGDPPLLIRNAPEIDAIRSIGHAQRNKGERRLPLPRTVEHLHGDTSGDRSDDIGADGPEKVVVPEAIHTTACRQREGDSDGQGVDKKVDHRRGHQ